jgi:hypothetical protein
MKASAREPSQGNNYRRGAGVAQQGTATDLAGENVLALDNRAVQKNT